MYICFEQKFLELLILSRSGGLCSICEQSPKFRPFFMFLLYKQKFVKALNGNGLGGNCSGIEQLYSKGRAYRLLRYLSSDLPISSATHPFKHLLNQLSICLSALCWGSI